MTGTGNLGRPLHGRRRGRRGRTALRADGDPDLRQRRPQGRPSRFRLAAFRRRPVPGAPAGGPRLRRASSAATSIWPTTTRAIGVQIRQPIGGRGASRDELCRSSSTRFCSAATTRRPTGATGYGTIWDEILSGTLPNNVDRVRSVTTTARRSQWARLSRSHSDPIAAPACRSRVRRFRWGRRCRRCRAGIAADRPSAVPWWDTFSRRGLRWGRREEARAGRPVRAMRAASWPPFSFGCRRRETLRRPAGAAPRGPRSGRSGRHRRSRARSEWAPRIPERRAAGGAGSSSKIAEAAGAAVSASRRSTASMRRFRASFSRASSMSRAWSTSTDACRANAPAIRSAGPDTTRIVITTPSRPRERRGLRAWRHSARRWCGRGSSTGRPGRA